MIDYLMIFLVILGIGLILYVVYWAFTTPLFDAIYLFQDRDVDDCVDDALEEFFEDVALPTCPDCRAAPIPQKNKIG